MSTTETGATPLAQMPDHARLWVFASPHPLAPHQSEPLLRQVDAFVQNWLAHGHPVIGGFQWLHEQFLMVAADEEATGVSGCSIDSLFRVLKQAERDLGVPLMDASRVWYRDAAGRVRSVTRAEFRDLVAQGTVAGDTPVFDNTVATVGALRAGGWERPMRESWHGKAFGRG